MFSQYLELALNVSAGMLKNGGETYRAEECALNILKAGGARQTDILAFPTGITLSAVCGNESYARVCSVKTRGIDLGRIDFYNTLSREVCSGIKSVGDALRELGDSDEKPPAFFKRAAFSSFSSASFTIMLGGGIKEFLAALVISFIAQLFVSSVIKYKKAGSTGFLTVMLASILIAASARLCLLVLGDIDLGTVITGGIIPMLPGLAMLNAIRDTLGGDLISGVARGVEALLSAIAIAAGVGVALSLF